VALKKDAALKKYGVSTNDGIFEINTL